MAKYQRSFLVPYLRDVCCLEMLNEKLSRELNQCNNKVNYYTKEVNQSILSDEVPKKSDYKFTDDEAGNMILPGTIAGISLLIGFSCRNSNGLLTQLFGFVAIGFGALMAFAFLVGIWDAFDKRSSRYDEDVKIAKNRAQLNKKILSERPQNERNLKQWTARRNVAQSRLKEVQSLRQKVYGVNIIPTKYRNIYASYYLYDFFNTSRADDLEQTLQTMLLDEIKQQLTQIISQNEQILLNQRVQLALQEESNRTQAFQHQEQMKHLISMESNQELQLDYQNMLLRNQEVTNFFLAADYLRKH